MADFRKRLFGLAAAAVTFAGAAFGQATYSGIQVTPGFIRSEGTTEQLNPITISLGSTLNAPPGFNVTVYLAPALPVTSKVLSTSTGATEAVATSGNATVNGTIGGNGQINFTFTTAPGPTIIINNIRVNATSLASTTGLPPNVTFTAFLGGAGVIPASTTSPTVAFVQSGLAPTKVLSGSYSSTSGPVPVTAGTAGASSYTICNAITAQGGSTVLPTPAFVAQINEGFAQAFKSYAQESSAFITTPVNTVNSGTRLAVTFANLPTGSGFAMYVPTTVNAVSGNGVITLVTSATAADTPALPAVSATTNSSYSTVTTVTGGVAPVTVSGGTATAYYEVSTGDPNVTDVYNVPVFLIASANAVTANGTSTVSVSFAPTGAATIPNFVSGSSSNTVNATAFNLCTTSLLFPFVTNAAGFDTGLAISNTSLDPFGTRGATSQAGTCTMNFYGATSPAAVTSASIAAGSVYTGLVSTLAAGFQGYLIAQCNFQFAHGFAFITDGFGGPGRGLSQGYLALVIPDVNQQSRRSNPTGESLTN